MKAAHLLRLKKHGIDGTKLAQDSICMNLKRLILCAPLWLVACSGTKTLLVTSPLDGEACVGGIDAVPAGLTPVDDPALLKEALGKSGEGKLCTGRVFTVSQPVSVWRVWNSAKSYTELGKWWALTKPAGTVDSYREENDICPEWSDLNQLTRCSLKVGSHIVVGPGQSAKCASLMYKKSPINQVYMANDTRINMLQVEACEQLGTWP